MRLLNVSTKLHPGVYAKVDDRVYDFLMTLRIRGGRVKKWRVVGVTMKVATNHREPSGDVEHLSLSWLVSNLYDHNFNVTWDNLREMSMPPNDEIVIVHGDRDNLNNQCMNLLMIEKRRVQQFASSFKTRLSRSEERHSNYCGVARVSSIGHWSSKMRIRGVDTYLGTFDDEITAARVYDDKLVELGLSRINFP